MGKVDVAIAIPQILPSVTRRTDVVISSTKAKPRRSGGGRLEKPSLCWKYDSASLWDRGCLKFGLSKRPRFKFKPKKMQKNCHATKKIRNKTRKFKFGANSISVIDFRFLISLLLWKLALSGRLLPVLLLRFFAFSIWILSWGFSAFLTMLKAFKCSTRGRNFIFMFFFLHVHGMPPPDHFCFWKCIRGLCRNPCIVIQNNVGRHWRYALWQRSSSSAPLLPFSLFHHHQTDTLFIVFFSLSAAPGRSGSRVVRRSRLYLILSLRLSIDRCSWCMQFRQVLF